MEFAFILKNMKNECLLITLKMTDADNLQFYC
jgi:hypothetical protein